MHVRTASPDDALAVETVRVRGWQGGYGGIVPQAYLDAMVVDSARRFEQLSAGTTTTLVAEVDGAVVGMAVHGPARDADCAGLRELYAMYVDPAAWRGGVGSALLDACDSPDVLWVLEDNARGRAFYAAHGYVPDGTGQVIDLGEPVSEIRMVLQRG